MRAIVPTKIDLPSGLRACALPVEARWRAASGPRRPASRRSEAEVG